MYTYTVHITLHISKFILLVFATFCFLKSSVRVFTFLNKKCNMELNLVIVYFFEVRFCQVLHCHITELKSKAHSFLAVFLCGFDKKVITKLIQTIKSKGIENLRQQKITLKVKN